MLVRPAFRLLPAAFCAAFLTACGGAGDGTATAQGTRSARPLAASPRAEVSPAQAQPLVPFHPNVYDPAQADHVTVGTIVVGDTRYNDVVVTFTGLVGIGNGVATRTYNGYDGATGRLTLAGVTVGGATYTDVVLTLGGIVSVGGAAALAPVVPNDPLFPEQWHLRNTGQAGFGGSGTAGEDLNVLMAWNHATGTGIRIAVIDDGLDIGHEDLQVVAGKSWDYRTNAYGDPSSAQSSHGTSCAGLAAAKGHNGVGVTGVAFNAQLVGYNLLSATTGDFGADAVVKDLAENQIYTNSYGSADSNGLYARSEQVWRDAIDTGTRQGRGGKGAVYTWAAGNGAPEDRSDYDGQANYQGVLAIGSLNAQGTRSSYSEPGANLLVMAFGGEHCNTQTTVTVDVSGGDGYNNGATSTKPGEDYTDLGGKPHYTRCMNGTSAATPQAAGTAALLLEANPNLGWRDVRAILARTARKNDPGNAGWVTNGGGLRVNHEYGFGAIDATAAVAAARTWSNLPAQKTASAAGGGGAIADNAAALSVTLSLAGSGIAKLEFVDLNLDIDHPEVGELEIVLTSPAGTASTLSVPRDCKSAEGAVVSCGAALRGGFRFGIARLMDEAADGTWRLAVRDARAGNSGTLTAWSIKVYGH
jgi:proprotein convertase subtilisin/kexin type 2